MAIRPSFNRWLPLICALVLPFGAHAELKSVAVVRGDVDGGYRTEGIVEAVRHADLAAQAPGRVMDIRVKAGDKVAAGAVLLLIDARAAQDQQVAAGAQLDAAQHEYERSRELFAKNYISKAAMDRAEAHYRVARAQANVAGTQSDFHRVAAPYAGVVAEVLVEVGDMAQPGKPLLKFYDPTQLRVTAQVPESIASTIVAAKAARIEISGANTAQKNIESTAILVLPTANPATHTREVRAMLPAGADVVPGVFARVTLPLLSSLSVPLGIPISAVVTRTEFQGVYVVDANGRAQLRQVRLGRRSGDRVEVLAGLREGEQIAVEPLVALRTTQTQPKGGADE